MSDLVIWRTVQNEHGSGLWAVSNGYLTIRTASGSKTTYVGDLKPDGLIHLLMWDLAARSEALVGRGSIGVRLTQKR